MLYRNTNGSLLETPCEISAPGWELVIPAPTVQEAPAAEAGKRGRKKGG